jgi:hypothetical protein
LKQIDFVSFPISLPSSLPLFNSLLFSLRFSSFLFTPLHYSLLLASLLLSSPLLFFTSLHFSTLHFSSLFSIYPHLLFLALSLSFSLLRKNALSTDDIQILASEGIGVLVFLGMVAFCGIHLKFALTNMTTIETYEKQREAASRLLDIAELSSVSLPSTSGTFKYINPFDVGLKGWLFSPHTHAL